MNKNYLAKIIAKDIQGLQMISACCSGSKVQIDEVKFLPKNKIFLFKLERFNIEEDIISQKIESICKFEFVDKVLSKNINQNNQKLKLELITIDVLKNKKNYEISLIFSDKAYITLSTEIIEITLDDQNTIDQ